MERYVAIDNVCAWPNLTLLPNGEIVATIFNAPGHGGPGTVESWASEDDGRLWEYCGTPEAPPEGESRINQAAGLAADGALLVISSGRDLTKEPRVVIPRPRVYRSDDDGRTWERISEVPVPATAHHHTIPFGDVVATPDGLLAASFYGRHRTNEGQYQSFLIFSHDGGVTWEDWVEIGTWDHDETSVLRMEDGRWIAAARTVDDMHVDLFVSDDEGRTWEYGGPLTLTRQHPPHLCRMNDGCVLLVYGIRNPGVYAGVGARLSDDGERWGTPCVVLAPAPGDSPDGGYPSSVQVADGTIVTAYYAERAPAHCRYHMGVVRWRMEDMQQDMLRYRSARWRT